MSWIKKKKKRESIGEMESEYAKMGKEKERLLMKKELRESEREISRLKHPQQEEFRKGAKRAGSRIVRFAGGLAREGARSYGKTKRTLRTKRSKIQRMQPKRSFVQPDGGDISLSGAIARADWSGGSNIMNTQFFGSDMNHEEKDFFGSKQMENLTGSNKKKKYI